MMMESSTMLGMHGIGTLTWINHGSGGLRSYVAQADQSAFSQG